jgi:hypothetical protein
VDRTETGWGQPVEPAPRWRSLLDRALLGRPDEDDNHYPGPVIAQRTSVDGRAAVYRTEREPEPAYYPAPTGSAYPGQIEWRQPAGRSVSSVGS